MKKFALGLVCLFSLVGYAAADEFIVEIMKVEGDAITFTKGSPQFDLFGNISNLKSAKLAANAKIANGVNDSAERVKATNRIVGLKAGSSIEGGLKNKMFLKIGEKTQLFAQITTNAEGQITQFLVISFQSSK